MREESGRRVIGTTWRILGQASYGLLNEEVGGTHIDAIVGGLGGLCPSARSNFGFGNSTTSGTPAEYDKWYVIGMGLA